jgi:hypothetical protein
MTLFQFINQDIERIKLCVRIGLIPCTIFRHIQIYSRYDYYKRQGNKVSLAVTYTGIDLKVSENTVYQIIKKMETEI